MAQALSMDLRTRLLAAVDEGMSCRAAASRMATARPPRSWPGCA